MDYHLHNYFVSILLNKTKAMYAKCMFVVLQLFFFSAAFSQEISPLAEQALLEKYPNAQKVQWDRVGRGEYEADFVLNGKEMAATYDANGNWMTTETTIKVGDLPKAVKDYISKTYPSASIGEAALIEKPTLTEPIYRAEIKNKGVDRDLLITAKGEPVEE
jgi:hypothetical protein